MATVEVSEKLMLSQERSKLATVTLLPSPRLSFERRKLEKI